MLRAITSSASASRLLAAERSNWRACEVVSGSSFLFSSREAIIASASG
jgi:hypothetical protein